MFLDALASLRSILRPTDHRFPIAKITSESISENVIGLCQYHNYQCQCWQYLQSCQMSNVKCHVKCHVKCQMSCQMSMYDAKSVDLFNKSCAISVDVKYEMRCQCQMSNVESKSSNIKCQMYFAKSLGRVRSEQIL